MYIQYTHTPRFLLLYTNPAVLCNTYLMIQDQCIYLLLFCSRLEGSTFPVLHLTNCADAMVLFNDLKNIVFFSLLFVQQTCVPKVSMKCCSEPVGM